MKFLIILFCFFSIFSYGAPQYENLVKVRIHVGSIYYHSIVNLSTVEELDSFFILGGQKWKVQKD